MSLPDDAMEELLNQLTEGPPQLSVVAVIDSYGFDKAVFAAEAYNSDYVKSYFHCHAWVSANLDPYVILDNILKIVMPQSALREIMGKAFRQRKTGLHDYLKNKRYLIVLEDVVTNEVRKYLEEALPNRHNGSRVLAMLTSNEIFRFCRLDNDLMLTLILFQK